MPELVPGIDRDADKQGGEPCIAGTRVPVRRIGHLAERHRENPAEIAARFDISLSDVHRGLAYYYDHSDEMAEFDRQERAMERRDDVSEPIEAVRDRLERDS